MIRKYESYEYEIIPCEVEIATGRHEECPQMKTGYDYRINDVYADNEPYYSDEWYDTESEAEQEAENKIDWLMNGGASHD